MFGASLKPPGGRVDFPGIPNDPPSESSACLQELARINKEIESVKTEVEKEQRRLTRYQTEQADCGTPQRTHSQTACKHIHGDGYKPLSHRRTPKLSSQAPKYVVDNSKPKTDLEYDPLSNFSADLRSYSSSAKEQKTKAGVKRVRDVSCSDPHKLQSANGERCPAPEDDLTEEGDLVIDIPSSPDLKKSRVHDVTEHRSAVAEPENGSPRASADLAPTRRSTSEVSQGESSSAILVESDESVDGSESQPVDMFDGLSKCLEDLRSENQKMALARAADPAEERTSRFDENASATSAPAQVSCHAVKKVTPAQPQRDPA